MTIITEHSIKLAVNMPKGDVHAKMEVFYNPVMVSNRNISILLLNCIKNTDMKIADPLAGSGIRSLRFLNELSREKIGEMHVNDMKAHFEKTMENALELNKMQWPKNMFIHTEDASLFLMHNNGFDYIEIDPFGSPNPFLAAAMARISRGGVLAVTATDTAALTGTYPRVTVRKYWGKSIKNHMMHEMGLRILIRKIQLLGVQFDRAMVPMLSYHKDHYFRTYFRCEKGKEKCDALLKQVQYFLYCSECLGFKTSLYNKEKCECGGEYEFVGPLWIGKLFEKDLVEKMVAKNTFAEEEKFLEVLLEEACQERAGFYDVHEFARKLKINPPRMEEMLEKTKGVRTHFSPTGIKTKMKVEEVMGVMK